MSAKQAITQVDAFTDRPFAGNPAAVCVLAEAASEQWMQDVAREMNVAETAFLVPHEGDGARFGLRWFTPAVEVDLCGHATLASAHALWEAGVVPASESIRFHTRSGMLTASPSDGGWIDLDFPARDGEPVPVPPELAHALGVTPLAVIHGPDDYLVEVESADVVRSLTPDFALLATLPVRGVIVTARSDDPQYDIISRFFAPQVGIPEDPVTGSAHCALGPYWERKLGKSALTGYQASPRGGVVRMQVRGDRVILSGQAVTVLRGEILASREL